MALRRIPRWSNAQRLLGEGSSDTAAARATADWPRQVSCGHGGEVGGPALVTGGRGVRQSCALLPRPMAGQRGCCHFRMLRKGVAHQEGERGEPKPEAHAMKRTLTCCRAGKSCATRIFVPTLQPCANMRSNADTTCSGRSSGTGDAQEKRQPARHSRTRGAGRGRLPEEGAEAPMEPRAVALSVSHAVNRSSGQVLAPSPAPSRPPAAQAAWASDGRTDGGMGWIGNTGWRDLPSWLRARPGPARGLCQPQEPNAAHAQALLSTHKHIHTHFCRQNEHAKTRGQVSLS